MKNVYFIPSVAALINWLEKVDFTNVRCVDVATTTLEELSPLIYNSHLYL